MQATPTVLAIDLSAQAVDLALINKDGEVLDTVSRHVQRNDNQQQDPQDWWRAVRTGCKDLLRRNKIRKDDIRAVGITGDDVGLVGVDDSGKALNTSHLEPHAEIAPYADKLCELLGQRNFMNLVGGKTFSGCAASLALYMHEQHPRQWHDCAALMLPRDFLTFRLTEQLSTDPSSAASTRLFNPRSGTWSKQVLERLNIPERWLATPTPGHRLAGRVTPNAARETGLSPGTPVATGAIRIACLAVAAAAHKPGDCVLELGNNGHIFSVLDTWHKPNGLHMEASCHTLAKTQAMLLRGAGDDRGIDWYTTNIAASDVQQWRRAGRRTLDMIAELAAEIPPGCDGLHFIAPNELHSGILHGLTYDHKQQHIMRALLEHVGLQVRQSLEHLMAVTGPGSNALKVIGPGVDCQLWCQIVADACNQNVQVIHRQHPAAVGCALLAATAIGLYKSPADLQKKCLPNHMVQVLKPRSAAVTAFDQHFGMHQRLHDSAAL